MRITGSWFEQVEAPGAAVQNGDAVEVRRARVPELVEAADGVHADALVAHEQIADAEDETAGTGRGHHSFRLSTNFHPPAIEEITPRPPT